MKILPLTSIALALALTGCIAPPSVTVREHALDPAQLGLGANVAAPQADNWWNAYGDAQLDRLMQQALDGNPTLGVALARVRAAQAVADATDAGRSPTISFDAKVTQQRFSRTDVIPPPYAGGVHAEGHQGLNLSWDLDFWGRQAALLDQAQSNTLAAGLDAAGARLALTGAVLQAYVDLDRQYALADVSALSAAQRQQILDLTRRRVGAGIDTNVDLREAEGAVPQAQVELRQAQADQARAVHLLAALGGKGADAYAQIARPTWQIEAALPLPPALPANLLGRRPDVLAARARVEAAGAGQAAAKAAFYPDINLSAFIGTAAIGLSNLFKSESADYGVGPAISLPLFDAGRLDAGYRGATAQIDSSVATYNDTVLRAVRDAADQLTRIDALADQLGSQRKALDAAEAAFRLANERYKAGLSDYLTVLNAETLVLNARRQRVELVSAQANARVALMLAVGGNFNSEPAPTAAVAAN
ncbi:MAG TPA: efflux transporter outer membrane subunit [Rudaea sp.]|jgi:NodT family efflux transporter outer membrane factor (OMF) lipoprotein